MLSLNWFIVLLSALIPAFIDVILFHPSLLGKFLHSSSTSKQEVYSFKRTIWIMLICLPIAMTLPAVVIHQMSVYSMLNGQPELKDPASKLNSLLHTLMSEYGQQFRTFKHGALHGAILSLFFVLPLTLLPKVKENKPIRQYLPDILFWLISLSLMGGTICGFA